MKIRLSPQHVRVRLGRTDLEQLVRGESLALVLTLPGQPLHVVVGGEDADGVFHAHDTLTFTLAEPTLRAWAAGQEERYPFDGSGGDVRCDIERDFPCTTPKEHAPCGQDTFERPKKSQR